MSSRFDFLIFYDQSFSELGSKLGKGYRISNVKIITKWLKYFKSRFVYAVYYTQTLNPG